MKSKKIGVIVGSLRKASWNRKIAKVLMSVAPSSFEMEIIEIGQLPLYNQDDDENPSKATTDFKAKVSAVDAVLFVTPEYNRSIPGVLKNAIDAGSRPYGKSAWNGKPGAVVSVSPGAIGGFGANHILRQSLTFLNVPCMQQPEVYISNVENSFDKEGNFINTSAEGFLKKFMEAFNTWIEKNA